MTCQATVWDTELDSKYFRFRFSLQRDHCPLLKERSFQKVSLDVLFITLAVKENKAFLCPKQDNLTHPSPIAHENEGP